MSGSGIYHLGGDRGYGVIKKASAETEAKKQNSALRQPGSHRQQPLDPWFCVPASQQVCFCRLGDPFISYSACRRKILPSKERFAFF